eukprot:scaffold47_cov334-Pavlova_lutheri.AAC.20
MDGERESLCGANFIVVLDNDVERGTTAEYENSRLVTMGACRFRNVATLIPTKGPQRICNMLFE